MNETCCAEVSKVKDIHSVLEITVFDEDADKKVEFLGRLSIPLLQVRTTRLFWCLCPLFVLLLFDAVVT